MDIISYISLLNILFDISNSGLPQSETSETELCFSNDCVIFEGLATETQDSGLTFFGLPQDTMMEPNITIDLHELFPESIVTDQGPEIQSCDLSEVPILMTWPEDKLLLGSNEENSHDLSPETVNNLIVCLSQEPARCYEPSSRVRSLREQVKFLLQRESSSCKQEKLYWRFEIAGMLEKLRREENLSAKEIRTLISKYKAVKMTVATDFYRQVRRIHQIFKLIGPDRLWNSPYSLIHQLKYMKEQEYGRLYQELANKFFVWE